MYVYAGLTLAVYSLQRGLEALATPDWLVWQVCAMVRLSGSNPLTKSRYFKLAPPQKIFSLLLLLKFVCTYLDSSNHSVQYVSPSQPPPIHHQEPHH
jgi:hypothetical protein